MKRTKRILSIIIPIILVLVISLGIIIPTSLADREEERPIDYDVENQQVYAAGDDTYVSQTGAATASKSYKGGAIFLEPGAVFNFKGGEISGSSNTYGGAIYISKGATFTMESGMITNCKATYGGAIYVESGATCTITGGTITGCKANYGAAIYVEKGANFSVSAEANIVDNEIDDENFAINVSEDTIMCGQNIYSMYSSLYNASCIMHYVYLGSYPQSHVSRERELDGEVLFDEIENWYQTESPKQVADFSVSNKYSADGSDKLWQAFNYQGELYVRGECKKYQGENDSTYYYRNKTFVERVKNADSEIPYAVNESPQGEEVTDGTEWFKVEPIRWLVLNYDAWKAGEEEIELISEEILNAMPFSSGVNNMVWCDDYTLYNEQNSYECEIYGISPFNLGGLPEIREWLNKDFYNCCFAAKERSSILLSQNPNSFAHFDENDYYFVSELLYPSTDWTGDVSADYVYLLAYYDASEKYRPKTGTVSNASYMVTSASDFAIANGVYVETEQVSMPLPGIATASYTASPYRMGTSPWWLRSTHWYGDDNWDWSIMENTYIAANNVWSYSGDYLRGIAPNDNFGVRPSIRLNIKP